MSELKVNKVSPRSGTAFTLGDSGDTFTVPSGATLTTTDATVNLPATQTVATELKTNKISPSSGTAFTFGDSGDTFTIPSGVTIANSGTATGFGGGKINQVVHNDVSATTSTTSTSLVTTNFTANITPSATDSTILGFLLFRAYTATSANEMVGQIQDGAGNSVWSGYLSYNSAGAIAAQCMLKFHDSPNTTSQETYTLKIRSVNGSTVAANPNGGTDGVSGFTLLEVLA